MIELTKGNILHADAQALVNTVNCIGYMGKGIALQFKKAFPDNFKAYHAACRRKSVKPGEMFVFETNSMWNPRYIINFPTKRHWRGKSRIEDIQSGLIDLIKVIKRNNIQSLAIPPLGCGLGGLDWKEVRPLIEKALAEAPDVKAYLFEPAGAPSPQEMPVGTEKPHLTTARALLIDIMYNYIRLSYKLTLLEIHKLAYFLQEAGEPLRLRYEAGKYGPYAHNLNKVLELLEGHYISGYGDNQQPESEIVLLPGAVRDANEYLQGHEDSLNRLERVETFIDGFQTPYGMELLSSVHWIVKHGKEPNPTIDSVICQIHMWNTRKKELFLKEHIEVAWNRINDAALINS